MSPESAVPVLRFEWHIGEIKQTLWLGHELALGHVYPKFNCEIAMETSSCLQQNCNAKIKNVIHTCTTWLYTNHEWDPFGSS